MSSIVNATLPALSAVADGDYVTIAGGNDSGGNGVSVNIKSATAERVNGIVMDGGAGNHYWSASFSAVLLQAKPNFTTPTWIVLSGYGYPVSVAP